jgi:uncharacterized RDD family membrane protein YckC
MRTIPEHFKGYYAGFISRLIAFIVDTVIVSFTIGATTWFLSVTATILQLRTFVGFSLGAIEGSEEFIDFLFGPYVATIFILGVIIAYHVLFTVLAGQTPGKALLGLRVVTVEGKRLSYLRASMRLAGYLLSGVMFYLGFLWIIVDDQRQAWHDKLAGTYVIYTWEARPDERFLVNEIKELDKKA